MNIYAAFTEILNKLMKVINKIAPSKEIRIKNNGQDWLDREAADLTLFFFVFFNWDSPHPRLNSHYEAWSYKKRSTKRITGYSKSV